MDECPDCGIIKLHDSPHICEHGVTPTPTSEVSMTFTTKDQAAYERLLGGGFIDTAAIGVYDIKYQITWDDSL